MLAIAVSRADSAAEHIAEHLHDLADWQDHCDPSAPGADGGGTVYRLSATDPETGAPSAELRMFDDLHLAIENVADTFGRVADGPPAEPTLLAFPSRHSGDTGALLTAHHTGNFGPAKFGGSDGTLARAAPNAHRRAVETLREHAPEGYEVGTECTHHGPSSVGVPSLFVELGSDEPQWNDSEGARAVARAVLALRDADADASPENGHRRHLVGFGGGHYAPRFERLLRETDWRVGHVAAGWALEAMGDPDEHRDVLRQAFEQSDAEFAVIDGDAPDLEAVVADLGYEVVGETWLRAVTGVDLGLAERVEAAIGPVADGVRFGDVAADLDADADLTVVDLPGDLLAEARSVDREAARRTVEERTVAFETTHNGTQVDDDGRATLATADAYDGLVDALADTLRAEYETVERTDDAVVVHERAFDPAAARERGVPEGPKFGQLSVGQTVTVDGDTVDPEDVHEERERRFPV
jgi:D-aminoacyl-tRNA deacylase